MITSKKKGQISVEALIIVGVLVVGGIIFATVFLSQMNNQAKKASDLSGLTDSFLDDLGGDGWGTPGPGPGTTPSCFDGIQNQSEEGIDCGGPCPNPCVVPGVFRINLILNPDTSSEINTNFSIRVSMSNGTGFSNEIVKKIRIQKENLIYSFEDTEACSYNGTYASTFTTTIPFNNNEAVLNFSCNAAGNYKFIIDAGISGQSEISYNDTKEKIKIITSTIPPIDGSFNVLIESPTAGLQDIDKLLILSSKTDPLQTDPLSCVWTAKDKQGNSEIISQSCNSIIDPTVYFTAGQNYTLYLTASTLNHSAIDKKEIFFVSNTDLGAKIFFTPPNSSIVGERFIAEFISTTAISPPNTLARLFIEPRQANCTNKLNEIKTYEIFNDVGDKQLIYGYIFEVSCLNNGLITVGGQIYNLKNEILDQAFSNYSIVLPSPNPTINFDLFLDLITEDDESIDADETIVELKEKKENVLYFASTTQGTNYRINAGQKFYIKPTIFDDPNNSINQCITTIATQANPTVPVRYFGPTDCNQAFFGSLNNSGIYTIKVQGVRSQGNIYKNKSLQVDAVPFFITDLNPNDGSTVLSNITEFKVYLFNSTNTIANVSLELSRKDLDEPNADFSKQEDITNSFYFAAPPTGYIPQAVGNINCNAEYTECTASVGSVGSLSDGQYILKATAKNAQNEIQSIAYSRFVSLGEPDDVVILGSNPVYHGTENKFYAVFMNSVQGGYIYSHPDVCLWNNNESSNFLNWEVDSCEVNFTPWKLTTGLQSIIGVQARDSTNTIIKDADKAVLVTEESLIAFPSSVLMADANTSNPNFGVHFKGSDVNFVILQKRSNNDLYQVVPSEFSCEWKYKLSTNSNYTEITSNSCNTFVENSSDFEVGVYDVKVSLSYDGELIYTKQSQFKIRECLVGSSKCMYNGVCEENGHCTYVKFPEISMDLANQHVSVVKNLRSNDSARAWYHAPFSGIGHSMYVFEPEPELNYPENAFNEYFIGRSLNSSSNAKVYAFPGGSGNTSLFTPQNSCDSVVSVTPLITYYSSDPNKYMQSFIFYRKEDTNPYDQTLSKKASFDIYDPSFSYHLEDSFTNLAILENDLNNSVGESSKLTIIATGLASENKSFNDVEFTDIPFISESYSTSVTHLFYYSLNDNLLIRRFALRNCQLISSDTSFYDTDPNNCSFISFNDINSSLDEGNLFSFEKDSTNYNYYYDYPQVVRDGTKVGIVGQRYAFEPNNKSVISLETYILYNNNVNSNNWKIYVFNNPQFIPIESRGNTLLFDSDGKLHYSFISGAGKISENLNDEKFLSNSLSSAGSQPFELVFDPNSEELFLNSIFPNPGIENSQFAYVKGSNSDSMYLVQPYESTVNYSEFRDIEFNYYSQQAINKENEWMAQIWASYPVTKPVGYNYWETGNPRNVVLRMALSNDNGRHWTAPIELISKINYPTAIYNHTASGIPSYFSISKDILDKGNGIGRLGISFVDHYSYDFSDTFYTYARGVPYNYLLFDINFGSLQGFAGQEGYVNYLFDNDNGQEISLKAGEINYDTYRKPIIISKISNDANISDYDYMINNCVLFNNHEDISSSILASKNCVLQLEPFYAMPLTRTNVSDNLNTDLHGCGQMGGSGGGASSAYPLCFKEGTKVYTPEGYRKIESIKSGDKVYSLNEKTKELEVVTVNAPLIHKASDYLELPGLYKVLLSNGVELTVTENHSFYVSNIKDYKQLRDITKEDELLYYNILNKKFNNVKIVSKKLQEKIETYYNLSLIENHNYLAEGIVVHNDRKRLPPRPDMTIDNSEIAGIRHWLSRSNMGALMDIINQIGGFSSSSLVSSSCSMTESQYAQASFNEQGQWIGSSVTWSDGTVSVISAGNGGYYHVSGPSANWGSGYPCLNCN